MIEAPPPERSTTSRSLLAVKSAFGHAGGRVAITGTRFLVAIVIVRSTGLGRFGDYILVLTVLMFAEWLVDFGQTDIMVRELSRSTTRAPDVMSRHSACKLVQAVTVAASIWVLSTAFFWSAPLRNALLIGSLSVVSYVGVLVIRVWCRAHLATHRDTAAELGSTALLLAAFVLTVDENTSLEYLVLMYAASRVAFLAFAFAALRTLPAMPAVWPSWPGALALAVQALPVGIAGLIAVTYDGADVVALATWSGADDAGSYGAGMRVLLIGVMLTQALMTAAFPLLARMWHEDRQRFGHTVQTTVELCTFLAAGIYCALVVGADVAAAALGAEGGDVATVIRVLALAVLAKMLVAIVAPLAVITGWQFRALVIAALVLGAKLSLLTAWVPTLGLRGVFLSYILCEVVLGLVPTLWLCLRSALLTLSWSRPLRCILISGACTFAALHLAPSPGVLALSATMAVYVVLTIATGAVRLDERVMTLAVTPANGGRR